MPKWRVEIAIEPTGREVTVEIEADSSRMAMVNALCELDMQPGELLHTLYAHIGRPYKKGKSK